MKTYSAVCPTALQALEIPNSRPACCRMKQQRLGAIRSPFPDSWQGLPWLPKVPTSMAPYAQAVKTSIAPPPPPPCLHPLIRNKKIGNTNDATLHACARCCQFLMTQGHWFLRLASVRFWTVVARSSRLFHLACEVAMSLRSLNFMAPHKSRVRQAPQGSGRRLTPSVV